MAFDVAALQAPFRMQPGLRRIAPGEPQLTPNLPGDCAFVAKRAVLASHWREALLAEPGFDAQPLLAELIAHAAAEHPDALRRRAGALEAPLIGAAVGDGGAAGDVLADDPATAACLAGLPPHARIAGLLSLAFAEDFALLEGVTTRVPWLAVCLPSSWSPAQKLGRSFADIHAPVADGAAVAQAGPALARLACQPERLERFVWTLTPERSLDRHPERVSPRPWPGSATADELAAAAFLRHERQTFIPVPDRRQAIFTIRVEVEPLTAAVTRASVAARLHAALASMSDSVLAYRGLGPARARLLDWLARVAGGAPGAARAAGPAPPQ